MNDPHVVALLYRVEHGKTVDYSEAEPLVCDELGFRLEVKDDRARFELKEHYATEEEARNAIDNFIRNWESDAGLKRGPDTFRLEFEKGEIIDRNPATGNTSLRSTASLGGLKASGTLSIFVPNYPTPPSGVNFNDPDVQTILQRYMGYRKGNEPLASMAYFCLTLLQDMAVPKKGRKAAADKFQISKAVLDKIAELSSKKGGKGARKAVGVDKNFTTQERTFLEQVIERIIQRTAEEAYSPGSNLEKITMSDLPPV